MPLKQARVALEHAQHLVDTLVAGKSPSARELDGYQTALEAFRTAERDEEYHTRDDVIQIIGTAIEDIYGVDGIEFDACFGNAAKIADALLEDGAIDLGPKA